MPMTWCNLRVPVELHARLTAMAADMLAAHQDGRSTLPSKHVELVPLYHVIERALDELDGHRTRARRQARQNTRDARKALSGGSVYTSPVTAEKD